MPAEEIPFGDRMQHSEPPKFDDTPRETKQGDDLSNQQSDQGCTRVGSSSTSHSRRAQCVCLRTVKAENGPGLAVFSIRESVNRAGVRT